jgi:hypothetical protein
MFKFPDYRVLGKVTALQKRASQVSDIPTYQQLRSISSLCEETTTPNAGEFCAHGGISLRTTLSDAGL